MGRIVECPECGARLDVGDVVLYPMAPTCTQGGVVHYVWVLKASKKDGRERRWRQRMRVRP